MDKRRKAIQKRKFGRRFRGAFVVDAYVRADGKAKTIKEADDPRRPETSLSLAALEDVDAAGLVIGFSSQGGEFTDAPALDGEGAVDMQEDSTYTNVPGEDVVFAKDIIQANDVKTSALTENSSGSLIKRGGKRLSVRNGFDRNARRENRR